MLAQGKKWIPGFLLIVWFLASPIALAGTFWVATNGVDQPGCGGSASPCRSINTAISLASDGDRVRVGPGVYGPPTEPVPPCGDCLIEIDRSITLESTEGAAVTFLDADGLKIGVAIEADGVRLGGKGRGFTVTHASAAGVWAVYQTASASIVDNTAVENHDGFVLDGMGHVVELNRALRNRDDGFLVPATARNLQLYDNVADGSDESGFFVNGIGHLLESNRATGSATDGFTLGGSGHYLVGNLATRNGADGFNLQTGAHGIVLERCSALANGRAGFSVLPLSNGHSIVQSSSVGNEAQGIVVALTGDAWIAGNNLYGNGNNCGLSNGSGHVLEVEDNYWGAPTGPGQDPADSVNVCSSHGVQSDPASRERRQPWSALP